MEDKRFFHFRELSSFEDGVFVEMLTGRPDAAATRETEEWDAFPEISVYGKAPSFDPVDFSKETKDSLTACRKRILLEIKAHSAEIPFECSDFLTISDFEEQLCNQNLIVSYQHGETLDSLMELLEEGSILVCPINEAALHHPEFATIPFLRQCGFITIHQIDYSDDLKPTILLDTLQGRESCDLFSFLAAWEQAGCSFLSIRRNCDEI